MEKRKERSRKNRARPPGIFPRGKRAKMLDAQGRLCYDNNTSLAGLFFCAHFSRADDLRREAEDREKRLKYGGADKMRVKITLACTECKQRNYDQKKNKKNTPDRIELNKYCPFCRKHTLHRETK